MKYLIDTDWVIDHLGGVKSITRKLEELTPEGVGISIISLAELYEGIYCSKNPTKDEKVLEKFLKNINILNINEAISKIFAKERCRLRKIGQLIDNFDLLIASTAIYYNLTVLTNNRKHFERIAGLKLISFN